MESRANYAAIGLFVLVMLMAGLAFIFWLTNSGQRTLQADLRIIFNDSVTGLNSGSAVLFNGIKIGEVRELSLDEKDPNTVVAIIRIDRNVPVKTDTRALLSFQGLTGVANLQLNGGSRNAPLLFDSVDPGKIPTIQAEVSPFQDILKNAQNVLNRADSAMAAIDDFIKENGPAFNRTVSNVETFSKALADNSGAIDDALAGVSAAGKAFGEISEDLKGSTKRVEELLAAVDPAQVTEVVANVRDSSAELDRLLKRANEVATGIDPAQVTAMMAQITTAADDLGKTIAKAQEVVAAVNPAKVDHLVSSLNDSADEINAGAKKANELLAAVDTKKVDSILTSVDTTAKNLSDASTTVSGVINSARDTVDKAGSLIASVSTENVTAIVSNVTDFSATLKGYGPDIDGILADVKKATTSLSDFSDVITSHTGDVDTIIADAKSLAEQLNGIAARADGIMVKVDGYVTGDGKGLIAEATATLKSIRDVSDKIGAKIGPIADNLAQFSGRGLDGMVQLIGDGRQALARLDRVLAGVERNPQQFIFGGDGVPEYSSRRR